MESGYASLCSTDINSEAASGRMSNNVDDRQRIEGDYHSNSQADNESTHTLPNLSESESRHVCMQFENFLHFCSWLVTYKPNWHDWTPNSDIRDHLTPQLLQEGQSLLWDCDINQGNNFQTLDAARDGDENVVALAVLIAKNHKVLNTKNNLRQTILHMTAETCSAKLSRLIINCGADGSIPDVWGDTPLHIAASKGRADVITALTLPLTRMEVKHPHFKCPYTSLPQDNVYTLNHD